MVKTVLLFVIYN